MNVYFNYWKLAYEEEWVTEEELREVVKTDTNPYGYISKDEFKIITKKNFNDSEDQ